jgi:hypothetical protein
MDYSNREFMIFSVTELPKIDFNEVKETSIDTVRKSVDGKKTFVKWDGDTIPASVDGLETKQGPYTYIEMINILATEEWSPTNPMIPMTGE